MATYPMGCILRIVLFHRVCKTYVTVDVSADEEYPIEAAILSINANKRGAA
jgi:hypothetical protein